MAAALLPDLPPNLVRCITAAGKGSGVAKKAPKSKAKGQDAQANGAVKQEQLPPPSADALVLAKIKSDEIKAKCGVALIHWYRDQQKGKKV